MSIQLFQFQDCFISIPYTALVTVYTFLQLKDLRQELGALRVAKVTGGAPNKLSKM